MQLLITPTRSKAQAVDRTPCSKNEVLPVIDPPRARTDTKSDRPAVAESAVSQGKTEGDGPGANGLSQGIANKKKAAMDSIEVEFLDKARGETQPRRTPSIKHGAVN